MQGWYQAHENRCVWLSYTEIELKSRIVQPARNLFDRAVTLLGVQLVCEDGDEAEGV